MRVKRIVQLAVVVALVCAAGCDSNNKGKIEGTKWSSQAGTIAGKQIPAGALSLEFASDGHLTYKAGPTTYTGAYSLGSGDTVTLTFDQAVAGRKRHAQKIVLNGDQLTSSDTDGTSLTFEKVK
jgi:hypothetical protein